VHDERSEWCMMMRTIVVSRRNCKIVSSSIVLSLWHSSSTCPRDI
jgi:hypothetical protein